MEELKEVFDVDCIRLFCTSIDFIGDFDTKTQIGARKTHLSRMTWSF